MEEGRARMKLNIYRLVNLIDAFMLFTVSLEFFIILEQEQLIILSTLIYCHY